MRRSYDHTIEYVMPKAATQPMWESEKYHNGSVNYRYNYHRAYYLSDTTITTPYTCSDGD